MSGGKMRVLRPGPIPKVRRDSIFLAGPTPRRDDVESFFFCQFGFD